MPIKTIHIVGYSITLIRQNTTPEGAKFCAYIHCKAVDSSDFYIFFLTTDSAPVNNTYNPATKIAKSFVPAEQLPWYIDLLRNEKPIWASINSDQPNLHSLYTFEEFVGEGE